MQYDFTTILDRRDCGASKWEDMKAAKPDVSDGIVPLSTADMEFKSPPEITEGLRSHLENAILGYTIATDSFYDALTGWTARRYGWQTQREWLVMTRGVVNAIHIAVAAFTSPGDGVIVMTPSYYPFFAAIERNHCRLVCNSLVENGGHYQVDFADLEAKASDPSNKILLLSNPHNPVGRVWSREELMEIGRICLKHDVLVISDEIHCDLIMPGYHHEVFSNLSPEFAQHCITCMAPSKTFNTAGMQTSTIFIPNKEIRDTFCTTMLTHGQYNRVNALGFKLCEVAYTQCDEWLDQLLSVLDTNRRMLKEYLAQHLPQVRVFEIQGTYLQWMDFRAFGLSAEELDRILIQEGEVFLDPGYDFGQEGTGFERMNLACPTKVMMDALERIVTCMSRYIQK